MKHKYIPSESHQEFVLKRVQDKISSVIIDPFNGFHQWNVKGSHNGQHFIGINFSLFWEDSDISIELVDENDDVIDTDTPNPKFPSNFWSGDIETDSNSFIKLMTNYINTL